MEQILETGFCLKIDAHDIVFFLVWQAQTGSISADQMLAIVSRASFLLPQKSTHIHINHDTRQIFARAHTMFWLHY